MIPNVYALLNVPSVTALVPSARIRMVDEASDVAPTLPEVRYAGAGGEAESYIADPTRYYRVRVQIDVLAASMPQALAIAEAIHAALDDHGQPAMAPIHSRGEGAYRIVQDWYLHATR